MKDLIRLYRDPAVVIDPPAAVAVEPPAADPNKPVDLKPGSASVTVDINTPDPAAVKIEPFILPEAYKDKPYLKGVDSQEKLLKMLDGAQELIGKKGPAIPKPEAPQAEWDAYYDSIGRPKTSAEYVLDGADKGDQKFIPKVQAALHKAGLTPGQAKTVWSEVNVALGDYMKEKGIADAQQNTDFDKLAVDSFGVDRDRVLARGKELIMANISPAMKSHADKLPNESLVVLADILKNIDKKYITQDGPGKQPDANGSTPDELRVKARGFMTEQSKFDPMSTQFQNLQKQIDECYNTIRRGTK